MNVDEVIQMTLRVGEVGPLPMRSGYWRAVEEIGEGVAYDDHVLTLAAYLHDWGAFPLYAEKGVEHALRSRQVAEAEILPYLDLPLPAQGILLEAIELHDYRDMRTPQSVEARLLREADMLEFLGMIGMAREFARGPEDVAVCYRRILDRRAGMEETVYLAVCPGNRGDPAGADGAMSGLADRRRVGESV